MNTSIQNSGARIQNDEDRTQRGRLLDTDYWILDS
jgi:hypothetical protein